MEIRTAQYFDVRAGTHIDMTMVTLKRKEELREHGTGTRIYRSILRQNGRVRPVLTTEELRVVGADHGRKTTKRERLKTIMEIGGLRTLRDNRAMSGRQTKVEKRRATPRIHITAKTKLRTVQDTLARIRVKASRKPRRACWNVNECAWSVSMDSGIAYERGSGRLRII